MRWEECSSKQFAAYVTDNPVCILTFGVIEKHGDHLPLGTDFLNVHQLATRASAIEDVLVFPPFYFGQILEAKCFPGTIALEVPLLMELVQALLDEIGRNGIKKIILVNGHGGNNAFLTLLAQAQLAHKKSYNLYYYQPGSPQRTALYKEVCETGFHGHACECETSISLANHPHLVDMEAIQEEVELPHKKLAHLPHLFTGLSWFANYPKHYVGDAKKATAEKGRILRDFDVEELAKFIKAVKEDSVLEKLSSLFHQE